MFQYTQGKEREKPKPSGLLYTHLTHKLSSLKMKSIHSLFSDLFFFFIPLESDERSNGLFLNMMEIDYNLGEES